MNILRMATPANDDDISDLVDELGGLREQKRQIEHRERALRDELLHVAAQTGAPVFRGRKYSACPHTFAREQVNTPALRSAHPDIVERFAYTSEVTQLRVEKAPKAGER